MDTLLVAGTWIIVCVLAAIVIRFILVKIAKHNGLEPDAMPLIYHMFGIGAYFTIIYPALFVLNKIF